MCSPCFQNLTSSVIYGLVTALSPLISRRSFNHYSKDLCLYRELTIIYIISPQGATAPSGPGPLYQTWFTIALRHTTLGRTPLDE